jgi:hypothetical protein
VRVKIFGERNTGTRALKALLEQNLGASLLPGTAAELESKAETETEIDALFRGRPAAHAWKHCATRFDDISSLADCLTIFVVKHPLAWLVSFFDRSYHWRRAQTLAEFAATPCATVERELLPGCFKPLDLYREKVDSYLALAPRLNAAFVRSEDIVLDPEAVLRGLGLTGAFSPLERSTKDAGKTLADYQRYYGEELWRSRLEGLTEDPDWAQVERFGYR